MKTIKNIVMTAAATVAMMATSVNNSYAAPEPGIASEIIMNTPRVMQYYHMNRDHETRRFEYTVDAQGRVTDKVMFGWNEETSTWKPMCQYHANYGTDLHELIFSAWDDEAQDFSKHVHSMSYDAAQFPTVISLPDGSF